MLILIGAVTASRNYFTLAEAIRLGYGIAAILAAYAEEVFWREAPIAIFCSD
jgi:hypothetical protein